MGYYGITYSANNLSGDYYLNYQLVMYMISMWLNIDIIDHIFYYE